MCLVPAHRPRHCRRLEGAKAKLPPLSAVRAKTCGCANAGPKWKKQKARESTRVCAVEVGRRGETRRRRTPRVSSGLQRTVTSSTSGVSPETTAAPDGTSRQVLSHGRERAADTSANAPQTRARRRRPVGARFGSWEGRNREGPAEDVTLLDSGLAGARSVERRVWGARGMGHRPRQERATDTRSRFDGRRAVSVICRQRGVAAAPQRGT
ncbi:hypothetical protein ERJ75_001775300 [Trypanosoma vivax]|nr:hypothetical protein ERJ75_001775300 [Trypanosoma vivax]